MCRAKELSQKLVDTYNEIDVEFNRLGTIQSNIDLKQQDVLHYIENNNFSACEGYKLSKQLKDIRNERREIKTEIEAIKSLRDRIHQYKSNIIQTNEAIMKLEEKKEHLKEEYLNKHKIYNNKILKEVV